MHNWTDTVVPLRSGVRLLVLIAVLFCLRSTAQAQCVGDCGNTGMVTISDLILGVNIVLGNLSKDDCPAFQNAQGNVDIAQLVKAVNNALDGCPTEPTATITATQASTPTSTGGVVATATHTLAATATATHTTGATSSATAT